MAELPTGTVTFLFTDIEGSTKLLQQLGEDYREVEARHAAILRAAISTGRGTEVRTEGDSFFAVFPTPGGAVRAVVQAQRGLATAQWPSEVEVRVRMGLHTGEGVLGVDDYMGMDVHRAARISAAGHGGQVLLSEATQALVKSTLPSDVDLRDLGPHRLKDLEETERLFQLIMEGIDQDFPPLRTLDARPNNLPVQLSSFFGRSSEMARISEMVAGSRLVTLTGPGGIGKTRLALEVAGRLLADFRDGAFFVDLSAVRDGGLVPQVTADALEVRQQPGREPLSVLADHLAERELLLVLDNFEQVVDAGFMVGGILEKAQGVRILVTSRVPLHVYGEQEFAVSPLELPTESHLTGSDELSHYEAVALFVSRARSAKADFEITDENGAVIADIAIRLDGLPLAIELAASLVKLLSLEAIKARLERALPLLVSPLRDLPERQRTLRGAIEWSYRLLSADERALFARLGALVGGGNLDTIEVLSRGAGLGDSLELVGSLVDKSVVLPLDSPPPEPRYGMLETIREYAMERLDESGDGDAVRRNLTEHWVAVVESVTAQLAGPDQAIWIARLDRENPNFRASLTWALETGEADLALRLATGLRTYWRGKGHFREGVVWLKALLALPGAQERSVTRAGALTALTDLDGWLGGDQVDLARFTQEAVDIYREAGDQSGMADALGELGGALLHAGDLPAARSVLTEAREVNLELGNTHKAAENTVALGLVALIEGDLAEARRSIEYAHRTFAKTDPFWSGLSDRFLGQLDRLEGNLEAAQLRYRQSLESSRSLGNLWGISFAIYGFADLALAREDYERAVRLGEAVRAIRADVGEVSDTETLLLRDAVEDARAHMDVESYERARAEGRSMSVEEATAYALEG